MALVPCRQCRQPFYASCHDASCIDALCPHCEYAEPAMDNRRAAGVTGPDAAVTGVVPTAPITVKGSGHSHRPVPPTPRGRG